MLGPMHYNCYLKSRHGGVYVLAVKADDAYAARQLALAQCPDHLVLRVERDKQNGAAAGNGATPARYPYGYNS